MTTYNLSDIPHLATGLLQSAQGDLHLLLDPEKPAWAVVNPTGMEVVRLCDGARNIQAITALLAQKYRIPAERAQQDVLGYIHNLTSAGLLRSHGDEPDNAGRQAQAPEAEQWQIPALKGIYLHVTNSCNLRCEHCYATGMGIGECGRVPALGAHTDAPLQFKAIRCLIDRLSASGGDSLVISGGEPLLRRDIKQILSYASGKLKTTLLTNGILIDEEMTKFLSHLGIYVQISLDGMSRSVHEGIRGQGTFQRAMRAIELLLACNMEEQLTLSISIMKSNLAEVPKLIEFALQSGISQVNMRPVVAQGNALLNWKQISPTPNEYAQLFDEVYPLLFEYREKLIIRGCLSDFIFGTLANPQKRGCPAGEKLMIDSNGDVYPCPMMSHPDYRLGNITNESLSEIRSSPKLKQMCQQFARRIEHIAKCQACQWRGFCRAACPGVALQQKGTIWDIDDLCDVRADFYRRLIFKYAGSL